MFDVAEIDALALAEDGQIEGLAHHLFGRVTMETRGRLDRLQAVEAAFDLDDEAVAGRVHAGAVIAVRRIAEVLERDRREKRAMAVTGAEIERQP